jgi:hypothetical protein
MQRFMLGVQDKENDENFLAFPRLDSEMDRALSGHIIETESLQENPEYIKKTQEFNQKLQKVCERYVKHKFYN